MGVWNSMRHDARVARTAGALAKMGARVEVIAASWEESDQGEVDHPLGFHVVTLRRPFPWALSVKGAGASTFGLVSRTARALPAYIRFMRALWKSGANVYHAHDLQALPWVWIVARLRRRPIIYDAHEISTDRTSLRRAGRFIRYIERFFARRCDAMITTTDMRADFFVEEYGVARPVVLQNRPYLAEVKRTDRLRDHLAISDSLPLVLYQGGMQPGRGLERLIDIVPRIENARFIFLGNGNLRGMLEQRAVELGVSGRTHFVDAVPWEVLPEWTASADIGIQLLENTCLNHYTTDSNKIFEYAMSGLAVLASDFPEIRKIVQGYGYGVVVDPADTKAVEASLLQLVDDEPLRSNFQQKALSARQELSWESIAPALIRLYEQLLASRHPGNIGRIER